MLIKWFSHLGTLASLIGIILLQPSNYLKLVLGITAALLFVVTIIYEKKTAKKPGLYCETESEINNYMYNWIKNGGRVTIFTRDMSWAQTDSVIKDMLIQKSKAKELNIILAERNSFIEELERSGANINVYGELGYTPTSRFTIVKTGRIDSKVAIGTERNGKHYIEEFKSGDGYPLHIANDLANILIKLNDSGRNF